MTTSSTRSWLADYFHLGRPRIGIALVCLVSAAALLAACAHRTSLTPGPEANPQQYAAGLWAQRPRVRLSFDVAADLHTVTGQESVLFTSDLATCQLVFRAWPNNPTMSRAGDSLVVTDATVNGRRVVPDSQPAGAPAGAPPTLIALPLDLCLNPGESARADLGFQLTLGADADERVGYSPTTQTAWFGSGYPLLAWVRGQGWARDPAVPMNGETAVSEDFALELSVTAPSEFTVQGTGTATGDTPGPVPGTTTHRFAAPAVRDIAVGVGRYTVTDRTVSGVHLHVATPTAGARADPSEWVDQLESSISQLSRLFGPFPYPDLWVTITPGQSDGSEFPAALQFGDTRTRNLRALVAHEVAHQWFYALVGNNQARDPWLDEALATYGEAQTGGDAGDYAYRDVPDRVVGLMGQPMSYWPDNGGYRRYTQAVYNQGAAVLLEARRQVGADSFDSALRGYIANNAHRVAAPADFARAFSKLPEVTSLLTTAGALPSAR